MALYPGFNPVAREKVPDYVTAEIWRSKIENDAKAQQTAERNKMLTAIPSAAKGATDAYGAFDTVGPDGVKTGNKIGDWVGGKMGDMGLDPRANALREGTDLGGSGGDPFNMPNYGAANPPTSVPPSAPPSPVTGGEGMVGNIGSTSIPESLFTANPVSSQVSGPAFMPTGAAAPEALTASLGAPSSTSALAAPVAETLGAEALGIGAGASAETLAASTAAAEALAASTAGTTAATAAGTGAATAAGAGAGAAGGLSAAAGPLAAMGPYGWAALAALAIGSQFM